MDNMSDHRKTWFKEQAIARLSRNGAKLTEQTIQMEKPGLKNLASIDCLCHYFGYQWLKH